MILMRCECGSGAVGESGVLVFLGARFDAVVRSADMLVMLCLV